MHCFFRLWTSNHGLPARFTRIPRLIQFPPFQIPSRLRAVLEQDCGQFDRVRWGDCEESAGNFPTHLQSLIISTALKARSEWDVGSTSGKSRLQPSSWLGGCVWCHYEYSFHVQLERFRRNDSHQHFYLRIFCKFNLIPAILDGSGESQRGADGRAASCVALSVHRARGSKAKGIYRGIRLAQRGKKVEQIRWNCSRTYDSVWAGRNDTRGEPFFRKIQTWWSS